MKKQQDLAKVVLTAFALVSSSQVAAAAPSTNPPAQSERQASPDRGTDHALPDSPQDLSGPSKFPANYLSASCGAVRNLIADNAQPQEKGGATQGSDQADGQVFSANLRGAQSSSPSAPSTSSLSSTSSNQSDSRQTNPSTSLKINK